MNHFRKISRRKKLEIIRLRKTLNIYKNIPVFDLIESGILNEDEHLNSRQKEVVELIIKGFSNAKISEKLFVSPSTVKYHIQNIYKIYNVHNRGQLIKKIMDKKLETDLKQ